MHGLRRWSGGSVPGARRASIRDVRAYGSGAPEHIVGVLPARTGEPPLSSAAGWPKLGERAISRTV